VTTESDPTDRAVLLLQRMREGKDWEDVFFQTNASFWKMIQGRRTETTISLAEMRARLGVRAPRRKPTER